MDNDDILTTQEAAAMLGAHIETIRRLARKGGIPAFKIGKDWRYSREALRKWAADQQQSRRQPTVLIVDDDPAIIRLMERIITPLGCRVIEAGTGAAGLDITSYQSVDLVLLDLCMPEMDGATFIARFRDRHKETPVILVTGYPDGDLMHAAMGYGPLMLVKKPIDRQELRSAVNLALKGHMAEEARQAADEG